MEISVPLFRHVIDYAGTFPPANLPFDDAIRNHAAYAEMPESWMLGRFVCQASRLNGLLSYRDQFSSNRPCRLTVLVGRNLDDSGFFPALDGELERIRRFRGAAGDVFRIESIECPLPMSEIDRDVSLDQFLARLAHAVRGALPEGIATFVEIPISEMSTSGPGSWAAAFAAAIHASTDVRLAAKVRCGGPVGAEIPGIRSLARAIYAFAEHRISWKATAGLHHPFRMRIAGTSDVMHGFVNVLVGAVLAYSKKVALPELEALIAEEEPQRFLVGTNGISWRGVRATNEEVERARREFMLSFGSCSFEEPRDELRAAEMIA